MAYNVSKYGENVLYFAYLPHLSLKKKKKEKKSIETTSPLKLQL